MTGPDLDVAIVGDGPAGLALAGACTERGLTLTVLGDDLPWTSTYGIWLDDVPELPVGCFGHVSPSVVVQGRRRHVLERPYGVVAEAALRQHLGARVDRQVGRAERVQHFAWGSRVVADRVCVDARFVVDAAGRAEQSWSGSAVATPAAWQTAFGVVVPEPPPRFDDGRATLMDLRAVPGDDARPTFCYVVPVRDGWLVEETALAARPAIAPAVLRERLVARLGVGAADAVTSGARLERVAIPLGGLLPSRRQPVVAFGAAAGYTHPATGYSVGASLRAAPRVADALAAVVHDGRGPPDTRPVWEAVWPRSARHTRRLHNYGLEVVLRLGPNALAEFFDAFFDLPMDEWSSYLRIDASPRQVSRTMAAVLRRLPWPVRRRVLATPPWGRRSAAS